MPDSSVCVFISCVFQQGHSGEMEPGTGLKEFFAFNLSFHTGAGEKSIFIVHVMAVIWWVPVLQYVFCRTP